MNSHSPLKLSLKHKSGKQHFLLGGLLLGIVALALFGRGVKTGAAAPSAIITVNSTVDGAPANDGQCTLREAVLNANANNQSGSTDCVAGSGADTIGFNLSPGQQIINLTSALPAITSSLTINGPGAASLTVRRNTINEFRIFHIPVGGLAIAISGLTIRDGWDINHGGGILSFSALTLTNCVITNNRGHSGGGLALINADGTITGCTISDNIGALHGGGIDYQHPIDNHTLTLINCTISGNTVDGGLGAGIRYGGDSGGTLAIINTTIANNTTTASIGGAIFTDKWSLPGSNGNGITTVLRNTIIANNTLPNLIITAGAVITSQGGNLTSDDGGGFLNQPGDLINKDPLFTPLGDYGGSMPTHALLPGSPAINAGNNTNAPSTDQRGIGRSGAPDIGAFESRGFTLVASGGNNQFAQVGNVFATPLRVIVSSNFAEPTGGGVVTFSAPGSGASTALAPSQVTITANNQAISTATANNQAGSYQVAAAANGGNTANFTLTNVQCQTISISPANLILPAGTAGQPYSQTFTQMGGAGAITWIVGTGSLPDGLTLNLVSGVLSGTPTVFGSFIISILATDAAGCTGTRAYGLTISAPVCAVVVNPATLPDGALGAPYNITVSASGGTASYTFAVSVGALPSGVSLSNAGALTGTPNALGIFHFTIQATDANGCQGTRAYTVTINAGAANNGLQFYPLAVPVRLLDTRAGQTGCSAPGAPIPGGTSRTQAAGGFCSIPANARALTGSWPALLVLA